MEEMIRALERGGWREEFWKAVEVRLTSSK